MRVLCAQINPTIGDLDGNVRKILTALDEGRHQSADLVLFPEMILCGYPPRDFLLLSHFVDAVEGALSQIIEAADDICAIVGTIRKAENSLFNTAAVICKGQLLGFQDKMLLPTYNVFDERRYFEPGTEQHIWSLSGRRVGITICEDIWQQDSIENLREQGVDLLVNLSASPYHIGKTRVRLDVCSAAAKTVRAPVVCCNQVGGNDSLIFDGCSLYVSSEGELRMLGRSFEEDLMLLHLDTESEPIDWELNEPEELFQALVLGVRDYFHKQSLDKACLGLSGGVDSSVVACIAVEALGRDNVLGLTMPSRFSSEQSQGDANSLVEHLGIECRSIPIEGPFQSYLDLLEPHFDVEGRKFDITEENLQARIRGMILMAFSNKFGYVVLSTGNKSEMAMGYATLYGDMCGGVGVISDVSKQQVYALARWLRDTRGWIPQNTIDKPPSAELRPNQLDSDTLPDYAIVDAVLKGYIEDHLSPTEIADREQVPLALVLDLIQRIHRSEYKRRQGPPGLRVTERAFSVGRYFPIAQRWVR